MLSRFASRSTPLTKKCLAPVASRSFHASPVAQKKVAVIGAAGGIGQPLSLLMKLNQHVTELSLYDLAPITPGVAADCSHVNTPAKVTGYVGDDLGLAVKDADVVIIPAGVPRKPGMTRDDLFNVNANIVANIAQQCATNCPKACLLVISNPVNSTVPIAAEILKKNNVYDPKRLFGVTTLDICRANTFVAENQGTDVNKTNVTVIGGHAGTTILPLLSQVESANFSDDDKEKLTQRIMFGGDEVVKAKAGGGSATLSMAFAGATFADYVLRALKGEKGIAACSYVDSNVASSGFFSSPVELGVNGIEKIHGYGQLDAFEKKKFDEMLPDLTAQVAKGVDFVKAME